MFDVEKKLFAAYGVSDDMHRMLMDGIAGGVDERAYDALREDHQLTELVIRAIMRARTIAVDPPQGDLREMLALCGFTEVRPDGGPIDEVGFRHLFPPTLPGTSFGVRIVRDSGASLAAQVRQMIGSGLRPATLREMCAFHAQHPAFPLSTTALGTTERAERGRYVVAQVGKRDRQLWLMPPDERMHGDVYHLTIAV